MLTVALLALHAAQAADPAATLRFYDENLAQGAQPVPGRVLVHGAPQAAVPGCVAGRRLPHRPVTRYTCAGPLRAQIAAWAAIPGVTWAEADWYAFPAALPDDLSSAGWQLQNTGQTIGGSAGLAGADIGAEAAWAVHTGDPGVVLAILDTGLRLDHVDLVDNLWTNPGEVDCADGLDDDHNGYVDDCHGIDSADGDADPSATATGCSYPAHGTFIGGLIGATTNNGLGIAGVNWDTALLPLKIQSDADCGVTAAGIAEAVDYAAAAGATALNLSWQVTGSAMVMRRAFEDADAAGVISVIAAGNDSLDFDSVSPVWPIAYDLPLAIVVAASTNRDALAWFTNHGSTWVDLAAPGQDLYSTVSSATTAYEWQSGTSFSAPLVVGALGLVRSAYPLLHDDELWDAVTEGVEPLSQLDCATTSACVRTGGRLSLPGALDRAAAWMDTVALAVQSVTVVAETDGDGVAEGHEDLDLSFTLVNTGHAAASAVTLLASADGATITGASLLDHLDPEGATAAATGLRLRLDAPCAEDLVLPITLTLTDARGATWAGAAALPITCRQDADLDGAWSDEDCDEARPDVFPGADEVCDGLDQDCDGEVDEEAVDAPTHFPDADGDGYGAADGAVVGCDPVEGFVEVDGDCDDGDPLASPAGEEVCDGLDQDCDDQIDEDLDCDTALPPLGEASAKAPKGCATAPGSAFGLGLLGLLLRRRRHDR